MLIIRLKEKKGGPILKGHPWIFSGSIADVKDKTDEHFICRVLDSKGHFVCQGMYNPDSQIAVRILTLKNEPINKDFFVSRIKNAIDFRKLIIPNDTTCYRLINAEGDCLPCLIADIYGDVIVIQFLCPGMEGFKQIIVDILRDIYPDFIIHERSDTKSRKAEGLRPNSGPVYGTLPKGDIEVIEMGLHFLVDVKTGDRTGFYLDHKTNRQRLKVISKDLDVLDLFCYTGGFSVAALAGEAKSVVSVDTSAPTLDLFKRNMALNHVKPFVWECIRKDAFAFLKEDKNMYDLVICDFPPFSKEHALYTEILTLAMARIRREGTLFVAISYCPQFSCGDLLRAISRASVTLSRPTRIISPLYQAPDHPYLASHPEGKHMHGFIVHVG
ncbi:MAG: class I SAM-dependent rRNA methyltransferase [Thermodesulfobacteriota bacterium]|nr:class I SAM-dependent rRNA methyltransferase [Thermodesulfobacteriota bacterium]